MANININNTRPGTGVINSEEDIFTTCKQVQQQKLNPLAAKNQPTSKLKATELSGFRLKLRGGRLQVIHTDNLWEMHLLSGRDRHFWDEWLQVCPARSIYLDPRIGLSTIEDWCELGMKHKKKVFLSFERSHNLPKYYQPGQWLIKRCCDLLLGWGFSILLAPLLLLISLLLLGNSNSRVISYQWHVGQSGRLFPAYQFHLEIPKQRKHGWGFIPGKRWLQTSGLMMLPRLINICRGEMSLFGIYPRHVSEVLVMSNRQRRYLNVAPGAVHICKSQLLDPGKPIHSQELKYLRNWNLYQELKHLVQVARRGMI